MKISCNWLRDYTGVDIEPHELADILTMSGLEVEGVEHYESIRGGLQGLVVGEVLSVEKHLDADKLKLTKVNVGNNETLDIVCGAPNVEAGQKVVVALPNAALYPTSGEPFMIKKSKIRGAVSNGMICAEDEIGLSGNHEGIMVLPNDLPPGMPAAAHFQPYNDWVLDVNVTANRGDAMSHIGVARDVIAWLRVHRSANVELTIPSASISSSANKSIEIEIENTHACIRYSGLLLENVTVKPSPDWMQNRLKAVGVKPINNVVDVTNFVMLECGQPLHAFDAAKIHDRIVVKNLPSGTHFATLDGKTIQLHDDDLMICDVRGPMCIAGVYGGLDSGVSDGTASLFLESACFDAVSVRKTSQRHQLRTDAAVRFEKGSDETMTVAALIRAASLLQECAGATVVSDVIDVYPNPANPRMVTLSSTWLNKLAGVNIPTDAADNILSSLGFEALSHDEERTEWEVPSYKSECTLPEDLAEEVLRIYGYENIPVHASFKASLPQHQHGDHKRALLKRAFDFLAANGFNEVQNNSLAGAAQTIKLWSQLEQNVVPLLSYSNAGLDSLRVEMVMPLLQTVRHNINRRQLNLKLFEYGKVYYRHDGGYHESEKLALVITGDYSDEHWHTPQRASDFFHLKGIVHALLHASGYHEKAFDTLQDDELLDNNHGLKNKWLRMGKVQQRLLGAMDVKQPVWYAEFDVSSWAAATVNNETVFRASSKFPSVRRDLALLLPEATAFEAVETLAKKYGGKQLKDVTLFDVFADKNKLGEGMKSYAVGFTFLDDTKTLEEADIDKRMRVLATQFEQQLNARIRQ